MNKKDRRISGSISEDDMSRLKRFIEKRDKKLREESVNNKYIKPTRDLEWIYNHNNNLPQR